MTEELNRRTQAAFGRPLYAALRGESEGRPWGGEKGHCWIVQDFRAEHRPEILYSLRDIDVFELGRACGRLQNVHAEVPRDLWPDGRKGYPPALPIRDRLALIRQRIEEPAGLGLPDNYAEWVCTSTAEVIGELRALGAVGFPDVLVDRDLDLRNASVTIGDGGTAELAGIFDPDFCPGHTADALRRPAQAFACRRPRLTIEDLFARDLDAFGSARYVLFLEAYLREYELSREELLAIPLLEKLELLTYRLFEDHAERPSLRAHADRFRQLTRDLVCRIDGIDWLRTVSGLLPRTVSFAVPRTTGKSTAACFGRRLSDTSLLTEGCAMLSGIEELPPPDGDRCSFDLREGWTTVMTRPTGQPVQWRLAEGYPFAVREADLPVPAKSSWATWNLSLHLHGSALHGRQTEALVQELRDGFPGEVVSLHTVSCADLQSACAGLEGLPSGARVLLVDPFRYLGDSCYIGYYHRMLQVVSPEARVLVVSRNEAIWRLFDCELVADVGTLPADLAGAVMPAFIDDQWEGILRLLVPVLTRTRLVLIPQRDLVVCRDAGGGEIRILHSGTPATPLRCSSVAHQTWHGLARLLRTPVTLQQARAMFQPTVTRSLYLHSAGHVFRRVFLNPFTSKTSKDLPSELCRQTIDLLAAQGGSDMDLWISSGIPGKPAHQELASELEKWGRGKCRTKVVQTSLQEVVTVMTSMDLVVTADTSISHLAAHKGIPCLVLWNALNWDANSPLDMVHNGPVGFSCSVPLSIDVTFAKTVTGECPDPAADQRRLELALGLLGALLTGPGAVLRDDKGTDATANQLTEQLDTLLYGRTDFDLDQTAACLDALAACAEDVMQRLQPAWREFAAGLPVPFAPEWMREQLRHPERIPYRDVPEQCCFAHAVWLASPLWKMLLSSSEVRKRRLRHSRRFLVAEGDTDYRAAPSAATIPLLAMPLDALRQTIVSQGEFIRQGYLQKPVWEELARRLGIRDEFRPAEGRLRHASGRYFFSLKGDGRMERSQYEVEINEAQFQEYWPQTEGRRVGKYRLDALLGTGSIRLDWFPARSLIIAELEETAGEPHEDAFRTEADITASCAYWNRSLAV